MQTNFSSKKFYKFIMAIAFLILVNPSSVFANNTNEPITSTRCNVFTFDATGSYDPDNEDLNFLWNFGDGKSSTKPMTTHTYRKSGDYEVLLTLTDNSGHQCSKATSTQVVRVNIPPYADFTVPELACANQPVELDASASRTEKEGELKYLWKFGDGNEIAGEKRITKTYKRGGKYSVTLTVDDGSSTSCSNQSIEKNIFINEPPIAEAGEEVLPKCINNNDDFLVTFDASKSYDSNNDKLLYYWDFGDGKKAEGIRVIHRYSAIGHYDAKLIVKDSTNLGCGTSVDFVTVKLNHAPKADAGKSILVCANEEVSFDGRNSLADKTGTLIARWQFGDGTSGTGLKTSHTYAKPGKYQAKLIVENKLNSMCPASEDIREVNVNAPPTVFIKSIAAECLGNTVYFDASSSIDPDGDELEYYWSFGDGTILKSNSKVSHDYNRGGNYRVTLIVDDGKGSACSTATATKNIKINTPPTADIGSNISCCVDLPTQFNASKSSDPDGDVLSYFWDFGDGTSAQRAVTKHTYTQSGEYNVTLTVDDNSKTSCSKSTASFVADVNSTPIPVINIR
ncbi:hypothetical protein MNBD_GAMMA03-1423 [hydrothermal vent metagenome]|uniref:PKD domain-containing protein n=1 Tax=hydrothermal vent metagenome TaxID=652676 RepID=A0A3B0WAK8_9ZZZZ